MDHSELVAEIAMVEKMATSDRLKHARKRRIQQLKRYNQYMKQVEKDNKKKKQNNQKKAVKKKRTQRVMFVNNIMLLEAAARNDVAEVRYLLQNGVSPDVTNEDGLTALHQCCIDDSEEMMKVLIDFKANVNARDSELWTPLHAAATCGHKHLCKYLIDNGAELLAVNADGNMPYDICEDNTTLDYIEGEMAKRGVTQEMIDETRLVPEQKMLEDLQKLAGQGKPLDLPGPHGETPLHIAAANGYMEVAQFLLNQHVPITQIDNDTWQPIHAAACWGQLSVLELLLQHGADLGAQTKTGETPLDICEDVELKQRMLEIKEELESKKHVSTTSLRRRRSSNTRSASVKRSSMREKTSISWKEAREEARLRDSIMSEDGDEDQPSVEESQRHQAGLPMSNIDEVTVNVMDILDPPLQSIHYGTPVSSSTNVSSDHNNRVGVYMDYNGNGMDDEDTDDSVILAPNKRPPLNHVDNSNQAYKPSPEPQRKIQKSPQGSPRQVERQTLSNGKSERKAPAPPAPARSEPAAPRSTASTVPVVTSTSSAPAVPITSRPPPTSSKTAAPPPEINVQKTSRPPPQNRNAVNLNKKALPPPKPLPLGVQNKAGMFAGTPPSGTLADLKRQRAQKLQQMLKSNSLGDISLTGSSSELNSTTNGHHIVNSNSSTLDSNGQTASLDARHRYTAISEIYGGDDGKQNCCIVM